MKAFVIHSYGPPDVLDLEDIDTPVPGDGEVLVRVRASSVNPYDWHTMRGEPRVARLMGMGGLRTPRLRVLGADLAGEVAAVGAGVTRFGPGDAVYALLAQGCFAEYACVRETDLMPMPANLSFEQAAAVPMAASTALLALRGVGRLQEGQSVLVNGASGGVGTFAVQLARALGAEVTGVCSTGNVELVRELGATRVIDYTAEDFTRSGQRHDLLIDIAGSRSLRACRRVLARKGTHVLVGGPAGRWLQPVGHVLGSLVLAPFVSQRVAVAQMPSAGSQLATLTELIEAGSVTPVIHRRYPFDDIPAAVRYQEQGHAPGKVVVTF